MGSKIAQLGMTIMAATELLGCGGPQNHETTPRSGETVERTDSGTKIIADKREATVKKVTRILRQCGPKKEIQQIAKTRCETEIQLSTEAGLSCISCKYETEVVE